MLHISETEREAPPASVALTERGIEYQVFRHAGPVRSLEQAAAERGQRPEQVVRCILFRLGRDGVREWVMVATAGPGNVPWRALRSYLGRSRISMATPDEVLAVTGAPIGAVSPFTLRDDVRVLVEPEVASTEYVSLGSGVRGVAIVMRGADVLAALPDAELVSLRHQTEEEQG